MDVSNLQEDKAQYFKETGGAVSFNDICLIELQCFQIFSFCVIVKDGSEHYLTLATFSQKT